MYGTFTYMNDWFVYGKLVGKSTVCPWIRHGYYFYVIWYWFLTLELVTSLGTSPYPLPANDFPASWPWSGSHVFSFVGRCKSQCLATESQWSTELTWTWTTIANGSTSQGGKGFDLFGKRCSKRKWCWLFGCVCRLDILINLYIIHIIHTTYIYTQYHLLCVYTHIYTYIYIFAFGICILGKSFIGHFQSLSLLVCRKVLNPHRHFAFFQKRCQWNSSTSIRYHAFLVPKLQLQDVLHAMSSRNFSSPQVPADNGPMPLFIRGSGCLISISNGRAKMLALKLVSRGQLVVPDGSANLRWCHSHPTGCIF